MVLQFLMFTIRIERSTKSAEEKLCQYNQEKALWKRDEARQFKDTQMPICM
ncbi:hypothetical protein [Brevibacillus daliensis]|uniref:hypothetical protein n=1 Tax=Brevibacillus daliensis TaxID=2892995 RepID=UPI001E612446|nr:hypothetical protein [Brevibacillus daliensis]